MPYYTFRNKKTGKTFVESMKIAEREEYLKKNPNLEQVFGSMNVVDAVLVGIKKPPVDFQKNVIGRIKESVPKNNMGYSRYSIPKEI